MDWSNRNLILKVIFTLWNGKLAEFFENGLGTEKDLVKAYMLYDLSTGIGREAKQELAKEMTDEQIKEAIARSWQWQMERGVVHPSSDGYRYR